MTKDVYEVEGKKYIFIKDVKSNLCNGCVAKNDEVLCGDLVHTSEGACYPEGIFKEYNAYTNDGTPNSTQGIQNESKPAVEANKGVKNDSGKIAWSYMPIEPMNEVIKVLMLGDSKYPSPDGCNWKRVPNSRNRYYNAAIRHLTSWFNGEQNDQESGYNHLAHAITNCLFLLWFEIKGYPKD